MKGVPMKTSKAQELARRIDEHGRELLRLFPNATERDPAKLCKRLRRIELEGAAFALRLCNGPEFDSPEAEDLEGDRILAKVRALLRPESQGVPIFLNRDPRGYALKIESDWATVHAPKLHRDRGGYGILAPDLRDN